MSYHHCLFTNSREFSMLLATTIKHGTIIALMQCLAQQCIPPSWCTHSRMSACYLHHSIMLRTTYKTYMERILSVVIWFALHEPLRYGGTRRYLP